MNNTYEYWVEEFRTRLRNHDVYYAFSDDHSVWLAGQASWQRINEAAEHLTPEDAAKIFNEEMEAYEMHSTPEHWAAKREKHA